MQNTLRTAIKILLSKSFSLILALVLILTLTACGTAEETPPPREKKEYLFATMTAYTNGVTDDSGVDLLVYCLDIAEGTWEKLMEIPYRGSYPANCADLAAGKLYYAAAAPGQDYDNLFVYDLASGESSQLTYGKFYFDDLLVVDGRLYANTARRYATVCQPAVFDPEAQDFRYFDQEDDDTWHYSMSYHDGTGQLLVLTCSDAVMRTHRVAAETHIRPKTVSFLDKDLKKKTPVFFTEDYEIRMVRQLDEDHILMTFDPCMASSAPRGLKELTVSTQEVSDFVIPGLREIQWAEPRSGGQGMYVIGREEDSTGGAQLCYFDMASEQLSPVFPAELLPSNFRALVGIVYSVQ